MAIRHAKLVLSYVCVTLILTSLCLGGRKRGSPVHHAASTEVPSVQHAARFALLNAVLAISAASLLFCSTGFALAGLVLFGQQPKRETDGLHWGDSLPPEAALCKQRRETAAHTLTAANWAVALLWLGFAWSLDSLRWALPPLPAWVTTCAAVLCAINLATGAMLAAKHSRWAPWLLPSHSPVPLNEPSRLVAFFEQLRTKCFGRRPGLPRAQKCCSYSRRLRRSRSIDAITRSPLPISPLLEPSPTADITMQQSVPAELALALPAAGSFNETSFRTPPRSVARTYSEDEEVDLSVSSVSSVGSVDSEDGSRLFMDVLQANILSHPDDTLLFLQRLSPDRVPQQPAHSPHTSLSDMFSKAPSPLSSSPANQPTQQQHQQHQDLCTMPVTLPPIKTSLPATVPPAVGGSFAERKQAMTRVSATVDELLGAIVGELV